MIDANLIPQPKSHARWPLIGATIFVCAILGFILLVETDTRHMEGRIYAGVSIGGIPVGGHTAEEARQILDEHIQAQLDKGMTFTLDGESVTLAPTFNGAQDLDLTYDIVTYQNTTALEDALHIGRAPNIIDALRDRLMARIQGVDMKPGVTIDRDRIIEALQINYAHRLTPAVNAAIVFTPPGKFSTLPEHDGATLTYDTALMTLTRNLEQFIDAPITIQKIPERPRITEDQVAILLPHAQELIRRPPHTLVAIIKDTPYTYTVTQERLGSWLVVEKNDTGIAFGLNERLVDDYLTTIATTIEIAPRDAKFSVTNGRVAEFQTSQRGQTIDHEKTYTNLRAALLNPSQDTPIELAIKTTEALATNDTINMLGIRELLGVGHSNFAGSPANRRHNISAGAKALHGIIIAPGEEFSLLNALGEIDAVHGYLPELVIKGNKTVPEFGGGLCQIGTTIFRATMASGLPILERQNHSYSVTYYLEDGKPGKDATIYNPKPDYRFKNDTATYILIQTRITGDDLYFEFWGTKDGRTQEQTEVKLWGRNAPPPTKIIETEDLPEGKKRCTERAHIGISAEFTYIVTASDGTKKEQTFHSTYRPWQEVCLLGVPKGTIENKKVPPTGEVLPGTDIKGQ